MALLRNGTLLQQYPFRMFGGGVAADRTMFGRGDRLNVFTALPKLAAVPSGARPPVAWIMPITPGDMSARFEATISVELSGAGVLGKNMVGSGSIAFSGSSTGLLIASGSGNATVSVVGTGTATAILSATAAGSLTITGTGAVTGKGFMAGTASVSITGTLVSYAVGYMSGAYTPFGELSAQGLAAAVWSAIAGDNNVIGTMGEKVNAAGAAGDPLTGEIEDGETLRETMRLLRAVLIGNGSGLEGSTMEFKSKDGTITRVRATYDVGTRTVTLVDAT